MSRTSVEGVNLFVIVLEEWKGFEIYSMDDASMYKKETLTISLICERGVMALSRIRLNCNIKIES